MSIAKGQRHRKARASAGEDAQARLFLMRSEKGTKSRPFLREGRTALYGTKQQKRTRGPRLGAPGAKAFPHLRTPGGTPVGRTGRKAAAYMAAATRQSGGKGPGYGRWCSGS